MTVAPGTLIALLISLGIARLNGRFQAFVLALFFLPYILPVSVVYLIWDWMLNFQFGIGHARARLARASPACRSSSPANGSCRRWPS